MIIGDTIIVKSHKKNIEGVIIKIKQNSKGDTVIEFKDSAHRIHTCRENDARIA